MQHKTQIRDELVGYYRDLGPDKNQARCLRGAFDYGVIAALSWVLGWSERAPHERRDAIDDRLTV